LEYNPLARAQNPLLQLSTTLQSLKIDLQRGAQDLSSGPAPPLSNATAALVAAIQDRLHKNIDSIIHFINREPAAEVLLLTDLFAKSNQLSLLEQALKPGSVGNPASETHVLIYLARINQALSQVYTGITAGRPAQH
jgi:hypothetical protein